VLAQVRYEAAGESIASFRAVEEEDANLAGVRSIAILDFDGGVCGGRGIGSVGGVKGTKDEACPP